MSLARKRWLAAVASTILGLALAHEIWSRRPEAPTVVVVDNSAGIDELLDHSRAEGDEFLDPTLGEALRRLPMTEEVALQLFSSLRLGQKLTVYDPQSYMWESAHFSKQLPFKEHPLGSVEVVTNDLGFRKDEDVSREPPDLRILVTGDSHTAGVVRNSEQFANRLQSRLSERAPNLRIEALNGGKGAYQFYNYLGVLEKFLHLEPDVFVMAVYGGNDFVGSVNTFRYFNSMGPRGAPPRVKRELWADFGRDSDAYLAQNLLQVVNFWLRPEEVELAAAAARQVTASIDRLCQANGIEFVLVYIPPCGDVEPERVRRRMEHATAHFGFRAEDLAINDRLGSDLLAFARARGIACVDLRPVFSASPEPCYWNTDLHINTVGHRLIAEQLFALLKPRLER